MRSLVLACLATSAAAAAAAPRYAVYFDQWHAAVLPNKSSTAGITHVITAFAQSSLFTTDPVTQYEPFLPLGDVRALFDKGTKVCMAIGGWGDTDGFSQGAATKASRKLFAKNVAATVKRLGYDCLDVDWEFPGGNGEDYKKNPNSNKTSEIQTYPLLLSEIKTAIDAVGCHELSIAVPALERDMIAYTAANVRKINGIVDVVNVMTYDLMNRRDNYTTHHTSLKGSLAAINTYIARGFKPSKLNLGFAFYAKWFTTADGVDCANTPVGCQTALLEAADGSDTGKSGAMTFEASTFAALPTDLVDSPDGSCGAGTNYKCPNDACCGQYGFCGTEVGHCGTGCQTGFGRCEGPSTKDSFKKALANSKYDAKNGGQWYWDADVNIFWTWDTPEIIAKKFVDIVKAKGLGGVMAWSLGEDSYDWSHLLALQKNVKTLRPSH
ncbi:glycoside hydrolase superfamily [Lasiosphaeria hispida]|uniref:chitinase n=1 Tax=Lasiosphaeria hispida TaxID=260671 RepID=A0AAJ0HT20_9PEZI|nr:glycoside hydrolase superfamily [Lasiosphaeria hispida]